MCGIIAQTNPASCRIYGIAEARVNKRVVIINAVAGIFLLAVAGFTALVIYTRADCAAVGYREDKGQVASAPEFFASNYSSARKKFRAASRSSGARLEQIQHPNLGPDGQELFTDIALLGDADAKIFLVLVSGTHGVEGFAGSAIQVGILESGIQQDLPAGTALLMIHAINPYGMAHLRRFNEHNVDVNRNFLDHESPPPNNRAYRELAGYIAPESMSLPSEIAALARLVWFRLTAGKAATKVAISGGQYTHPMGLFFGGRSETWSNNTFTSYVTRYLHGAKEVVAIDIHTALGPFGTAQLLPNIDPESEEHRYAKAIWDQSLFSEIAPGKTANSYLSATVKSAMERLLPETRVTSVTLEFGTYPSWDVFMALRAENWLHNYGGDSHPQSEAIKTCLLRTYYPDSAKWKLSVWDGGRDVVEQAFFYLAQ